MRIGIVGAGMAGLACAQQLTHGGHEVLLFDKGRNPGGRMSTRVIKTPIGNAFFDHGAQYFTVRDTAFRAQVDAWIAEGVAARWSSAGDEAYAGVPAMDAPVRHMAAGQAVRWAARATHLEKRAGGWRIGLENSDAIDVDLAIVAIPAEQASALLAPVAPDLAARAGAVPSAPCWTLMLAFAEAIAVTQNCWRGVDAIGWAARNNSKPGRTGLESWVVQASPDWSRTHLEAEPGWVAATLKVHLADLLDVAMPPLAGESVHRWRYAKPGSTGAGALFDQERYLGLCGDWLTGPRVEAAWLSGTALATLVLQNASDTSDKGAR